MQADSRDAVATKLIETPRELFPSAADMFDVPYQEIQELQLLGLRRRVAELRQRVKVFSRLADRAGAGDIESLADGASLLYPSDVYKSYKRDWLFEGQFDRLTQWVQQLTAHDLSGVDTAGCGSLDEWFARLESASPLIVCHSSATTGKLSFVPRSEIEWQRRATTMAYASESAGVEGGPRHVDLKGLPIVSPFYRGGHAAFLMSVAWNIKVHGDEDLVETLYPGPLSSDLLVVAAQLRNSQGPDLPDNPAAIAVPDWIASRWDELRQLASKPPSEAFREFAGRVADRFAGQQVWVIGPWPSLIDVAGASSALGLSGVFRADSLVHTGGGSKGRSLPQDAYDRVVNWLGVPEVRETYGMSEIVGANVRCSADRYHLNAWTIPYLFDKAGTPLPRAGTHRGRYGAIDLLAETYWGGYLSTDEVTLSYDPGCACGRQGPYLDLDIARVGGVIDDKVSCAATPALHDDAMTILGKLSVKR